MNDQSPNEQDPSELPSNVVDLATARKKQRTLSGASRGRGGARKKSGGTQKLGIMGTLQFLLFLFVLAYFMRLCSAG